MLKRNSHIWERDADEHYVEPAWCSERLFQEEKFHGPINDPCCGFGTIPKAAYRAGIGANACDLVNRGYAGAWTQDFFASNWPRDNIVCNPPFSIADKFVLHALKLTAGKVCAIFPTRRLNAMHSWIKELPLRRVWLLTPRPSMPPGSFIKAGGKPGSGTIDFCWLVFERGWTGSAELRWMHRDASKWWL